MRKTWIYHCHHVSSSSSRFGAVLRGIRVHSQSHRLLCHIRIDGEIVTVGSLPHLKDKYCTSYFVEICTDTPGEHEKIAAAFVAGGLDAKVYETLPYRFKIQIPFNGDSPHEQLAGIFEFLEREKASLGIRFYNVCKFNLEKAFIDLSRRQFEAEHFIDSQRPLVGFQESSRAMAATQEV